MLNLTPRAAAQVLSVLEKSGKAGGFLRLRVASGGCSGLSYEFEFGRDLQEGDIVSECHGAKLAVDPKSYFYVNGSTVDYAQGLMKSGFEVKNPNAAGTCNCGVSFTA